jgi:hypothetical protein
LSAKWPELLKQIAPGLTRAAVLRDPASTSGIGQFHLRVAALGSGLASAGGWPAIALLGLADDLIE